MPDRTGDLAIVLHSHMPYVEGFGTYPFGEEWLFDAVLRSYVPVMESADRVTVSVTPVLADQLEAPGVAERLREFTRSFRVGSADADAAEVEPDLRPSCAAEAERYRASQARLEELGEDLTAIFREPAAEGRVDLLASAATHAVMPMLASRAARRLQLDAGLRSHRRRFGEPAGFWLPECAYEPGLESLLAEHGLRCFLTDQSAAEAELEALTPVATRDGPVAFTIDWEAVSWLWSLEGYPSDPVHADFHRRSWRGTRPWSIGGGAYDPERASVRAEEQAAAFVDGVAERLERFARREGRPGLSAFAIDTELLGHWWWEGPRWLEGVQRLAPGRGVELVTLTEAIERHPGERRALYASTWGEGKDLRTWDSARVADLAWAARRLELRLLREVRRPSGVRGGRAERAARELLAVQSSDWAFLDGRGQAGDYAFDRATGHAEAMFEAIHCRRQPQRTLRHLAPDLSLAPLSEP